MGHKSGVHTPRLNALKEESAPTHQQPLMPSFRARGGRGGALYDQGCCMSCSIVLFHACPPHPLLSTGPGSAAGPWALGTSSTCQAPLRAHPSIRTAPASSWPPHGTVRAKINTPLAGAALRSLLREEAVLASAGSSPPRRQQAKATSLSPHQRQAGGSQDTASPR